jgi:hypothetical protein
MEKPHRLPGGKLLTDKNPQPKSLKRMGKIRSKDQEHKSENSKPDGMGSRGVTRPMMEMDMHRAPQEAADEPKTNARREQSMGDDERRSMLHMQTLWIYWMLVILWSSCLRLQCSEYRLSAGS